MVDDQIRLLVLQQQLEQEAAASGRPFVGLSVNGTIRQCLLAGLDKKADKTRSDFKVPDKRCAFGLSLRRARSLRAIGKRPNNLTSSAGHLGNRYWYIKLRALVSLRDWDALETFARSKKSPIGYEPWVDELIRAGAHRQAVRYVDRCDPRNRVELYIKCGEWVMAGQECVRRGERGRLQCVLFFFAPLFVHLVPWVSSSALTNAVCITCRELKNRAPNKIIAAQLDELVAADANSAS